MTTGIWREVRLTADATEGDSATNRSVTFRRSSGEATRARTDQVCAPISTVVVGWATRLKYQSGCRGAPRFDARTTTALSLTDQNASGVTRSDPDLAPK